MKNVSAALKGLLSAAMVIALADASGLCAETTSWKAETVLVCRQGDQTVVRPVEGEKVLFKNADPQIAIEWGLANARTTVVLAGKYVISDRIDIPRDDVTLIIDKGAELAVSPDTTKHTYIGFRPDGSWKRLCMIYNRGRANVRVISFGTITSWIVRPKKNPWTRQNRKGTPYRGTWPIFFDGRNPKRTCGIKGGMVLTAGSISEAVWILDSSGVQVPILAHKFGGDGSLVLEGCEDCRLGLLVNLAAEPGGRTGETLDMNGRNKGIKIERAIGERPYEIIDNNSSYADVGEVVSIGRPRKLLKFHGPSDGARYTSRPHPGATALNVKNKTILADAVGAAVQVAVPKLPDALPRFTVKATVEVTMKDGSKKQYTKAVEIDVRTGGPRPARRAAATAAPKKSEAASDKPFFEIKKLFAPKRIPKITVAKDGTVLAFTGSCSVYRRSTDSGRTWDKARRPAPGAGGNVIVHQTTGDVLILRARSADMWRSRDHGKTWKHEKVTIRPNLAGHGSPAGMRAGVNCSESGVTLQYGKHKGRLVMPARICPVSNSNAQENWWYHYNTAIYSDDGGRTWQTGEPIQSGTGEGTLAELSDGRIYYNSRSHMRVDHRRQIAWSHNGGRYFVDWSTSDDLFEVGQPYYFRYGSKPSYGCNAGLVRMPSQCVREKDVLLFSTPDNPGGHRFKMTVHASFDGAKTWPVKRLVFKGRSAYSSMAAGPDGMIYVLFERGAIALARFNLAWVRENATRQQPAEKKKPAKVDAKTRAALGASAKPFFEMKDLFDKVRVPTIVTAKDGSILAFASSCGRYRRSEDSGRTWSDVVTLGPGVGGSVVVDDVTGQVLIVSHSGYVWRSGDHGRTWPQREKVVIRPNPAGHGEPGKITTSIDSMESGITLTFGRHKGRLILPTRVRPVGGRKDQLWWYDYNTALYSDDRGKTWQVGGPVQTGTGEGTLAQLSDGRIYYNSRSHMSVDHRRQVAWSHNGGQYFVDWSAADDLREIGQPAYFKHGTKPSYGCSAGLVRMPSQCVKGKDVLLLSQPDNPGGHRRRMTVYTSIDGAKTWPVKRLIFEGASAYSSMTAGPDGMIYVLFERGPKGSNPYQKITLARFNMAWVLQEQKKEAKE